MVVYRLRFYMRERFEFMGKYDTTMGAPLDFDDLLSCLTDEADFIFWLPALLETATTMVA